MSLNAVPFTVIFPLLSTSVALAIIAFTDFPVVDIAPVFVILPADLPNIPVYSSESVIVIFAPVVKVFPAAAA